MNSRIKAAGIIFLLVVLNINLLLAWGFWGHKRINYMAVFTLPPAMVGFYKHHINFLSENAVNPDKRRYASPYEAPRHFIDIDHYGEHPFDSMPRKWKDAVEKYSEDTLNAYGIVPWHIDRMTRQLAQAFRERDVDRILFLSADLGHYVADAHVPLHTTENYNGQFTNQVGIHGFWESRIPELYGEEYDYFTGRCRMLDDPLESAWKLVEASHAALDSVLLFERETSKEFPGDRKYAFEQRGGTTMRVYSEAYSLAYSNKLAGMVERRMRESVIMVGSYWYTAWMMGGQPNLDELLTKEVTDALKKQLEEEELMWKTGKAPKGREHQD